MKAPMPIDWTIRLHVVSGALWALITLAIAVSGRAAKWLLALQICAALTASLAGIDLWHASHAGFGGPREHILAVGTFCALIAMGPQAAIIGSALIDKAHEGKLKGPALLLYRLSAALLVMAAAAMVGSLYA